MKVYVENIVKNRKIGEQYMKLLILNFLQRQKLFRQNFNTNVKNTNEPEFLPYELKLFFKTMATKQGLYRQVMIMRRKYPENKNEKENTKKYNFQGQFPILKLWFYLEHE